jgi:shikimate dehydrogenase
VEISAKTRLLAVIGDPVAHSLSPAMYNAAFRALGVDAVYIALRVPPASLPAFLAAQAAIGGAGNVTVPHKEAVERSIARKTDVCARVGACNTFWTEDNILVGDNTDVPGVLAALQKLGAAAHTKERWIVVGTGGSARAVAVAAADRGAELFVRSRDAARATAFAHWASGRGIGAAASVAAGPVEVDVAINATPLGLAGHDPLPIDLNHIPGAQRALDLVYAPGETRWVHALRERGIQAADGREMLVQQGAAALERFFPGTAAPKEVMRAAVQRALRA